MQLHHHNKEQQLQLVELMRETATKLLHVDFNDPSQDHHAIRHHAYLKGKLEAFKQLHDDNYPDPTIEDQS